MEAYAIARTRIRYIVPFQFNKTGCSFEDVCRKIDDHKDDPYAFLGKESTHEKKSWVRRSLKSGEQDIYDYVVDEFSYTGAPDSADGIEKMGCFWGYESFRKEPFHLKFTLSKKYDDADAFPVSVVDMGLYIFRSGIGFLWYEIDFDADAIPDSLTLIRFQNLFKELDRGYSNHLWIEASSLAGAAELNCGEYIPFLMGSWLAERLSFLKASYQAERKNSYGTLLGEFLNSSDNRSEKGSDLYSRLPLVCPDKALIFIYASFERSDGWTADENAVKTAYYLANGYKESYEMSDTVADAVRRPFSNVLWLAAKEGCGYFAWQGESNGTFFSKNQHAKIMNDYFLLYIRVIYQSYSLLRYTVKSSALLPSRAGDYLEISSKTEALSDMISELSTEINLFLVKSVAASVSHIQHQNDFYCYLCGQLKIREDGESVTAGLEALKELQQETVRKKEQRQDARAQEEHLIMEQREKKADNTFQIGLGLMTFLAFISAIADAYGVISALSSNTLTAGQMAIFYAVLVICVSIFTGSLVIFIKSVRNLKDR